MGTVYTFVVSLIFLSVLFVIFSMNFVLGNAEVGSVEKKKDKKVISEIIYRCYGNINNVKHHTFNSCLPWLVLGTVYIFVVLSIFLSVLYCVVLSINVVLGTAKEVAVEKK